MAALQPKRVLCIGYADSASIDNKSINDLRLGHRNGIVSANYPQLNTADAGDLVIIRSQDRHFAIGVLRERLVDCRMWAAAGGRVWKYTWSYTPLTGIMPIETFLAIWRQTCVAHGVLNPEKMLSARSCSAKCDGTVWVSPLMDVLHNVPLLAPVV